MEGASEFETSPDSMPDKCEPEAALQVGVAASTEATVENSSDSEAAGVLSSPAPTSIETDFSLSVAGQVESSDDVDDEEEEEEEEDDDDDDEGEQQSSRESPGEVASTSQKDLVAGHNDLGLRETLLSLQKQVRELETELKNSNDWAKQRIMQAVQSAGKERLELNALRVERDEAIRSQKALEESKLKKIAEVEMALRKASAEKRKLENQNAEVRAEMEAAKLSAAESFAAYQEVVKRDKKGAKRAQGWEKQKAKLQEKLSEETKKLIQLQQVLAQAKEQHQQAEVRWRQEERAREEAVARADKEKREKELAEAAFKRREEATRRKAEQDKQRLRDDIQRLTQELFSLRSANFVPASWDSPVSTAGMMGGRKENEMLLSETAEPQDLLPRDVQRDHECVMCMCEEMSVVFLPCAHLVVCIECNELHEKQGMRDCPSCRTPIQQRIRVYGASSLK